MLLEREGFSPGTDKIFEHGDTRSIATGQDTSRMPPSSLIEVCVNGALTVLDGDGNNITPRSRKCRGLIALLLTSRSGVRTRAWLMSKLWSDRQQAQAQSSLRQALRMIRRDFGTAASVLSADRIDVSIDLARVRTLIDTRYEFLEGLDLPDPAFDEWLRQERTIRATACTG